MPTNVTFPLTIAVTGPTKETNISKMCFSIIVLLIEPDDQF
jgi:hypothetical protein